MGFESNSIPLKSLTVSYSPLDREEPRYDSADPQPSCAKVPLTKSKLLHHSCVAFPSVSSVRLCLIGSEKRLIWRMEAFYRMFSFPFKNGLYLFQASQMSYETRWISKLKRFLLISKDLLALDVVFDDINMVNAKFHI